MANPPCRPCSRRTFLGGLATACGVVSGLVPLSAGAETLPPDLNRVLPLRIADFPVLGQAGGSIMLSFDGVTVLLVSRGADDQFYVVNPTCTHEGCPVNKYNRLSRQITCDCHGSAFAIDGAVINGPAEEPLYPYPCRFSKGVLEVELPDLEFKIKTLALMKNTAGEPRAALTFQTLNRGTYRIRRGTDPAGPFTAAPFSLELDSPPAATELAGDGDFRTVYVEAPGPRAFFALELVVFEVG